MINHVLNKTGQNVMIFNDSLSKKSQKFLFL